MTRAAWLALCLAGPLRPAAAQSPVVLPEGPGREVVLRACSQCHSLENVLRSRLTRRQWEARIDEMLGRGAKLTDEEIDLVAEYLSVNFGPG